VTTRAARAERNSLRPLGAPDLRSLFEEFPDRRIVSVVGVAFRAQARGAIGLPFRGV